jgi:hypothetical protein
MRKKIAFIAHPYGGVGQNLARAALWLVYCADHLDVVPVTGWIVWCDHWDESRRELGIELNKRTIERCDAVILCGSHVSEGMKTERDFAISIGVEVINLTGRELP